MAEKSTTKQWLSYSGERTFFCKYLFPLSSYSYIDLDSSLKEKHILSILSISKWIKSTKIELTPLTPSPSRFKQKDDTRATTE